MDVIWLQQQQSAIVTHNNAAHALVVTTKCITGELTCHTGCKTAWKYGKYKHHKCWVFVDGKLLPRVINMLPAAAGST